MATTNWDADYCKYTGITPSNGFAAKLAEAKKAQTSAADKAKFFNDLVWSVPTGAGMTIDRINFITSVANEIGLNNNNAIADGITPSELQAIKENVGKTITDDSTETEKKSDLNKDGKVDNKDVEIAESVLVEEDDEPADDTTDPTTVDDEPSQD